MQTAQKAGNFPQVVGVPTADQAPQRRLVTAHMTVTRLGAFFDLQGQAGWSPISDSAAIADLWAEVPTSPRG
jgi:hypothetical protein